MDPFTKGNIYIYFAELHKENSAGGGGEEVTKCAPPPPPGTHVASVEITALLSTRDLAPENAFIRRAVGAAIDVQIYRETQRCYLYTA